MPKKNCSSTDSQLFRDTVGDVTPLAHDTVLLRPHPKPRPIPVYQPLERADPLQNPLTNPLDTLFQEDKIGFIHPGLQKTVLKKLRKGQYGLDAELDLHGLTSQQAQGQLLRFLHDCVEEGCRCVQLIHGKGYNSPDFRPVLKNDLNHWLRQHQDVLAFCSTPPRAGGTGALYVLLRLSDKFDSPDDVD